MPPLTTEQEAQIERWLKPLKRSSSNVIDFTVPKTLDEYIGQKKAKNLVKVSVEAALKENRPLPNILISGPFGQGKTILARLLTDSYKPGIKLIDATSINKEVPSSGTYIIDEIHNLEPQICDSLNLALDSQKIHIIGCTTNPGQLPSAFRSRFRQIYLEPYTIPDITQILVNAVNRKQVISTAASLQNIARRSRFVPRFALNYLSYIFDLLVIKESKELYTNTIKDAFVQLDIDEYGFTQRDYAYMNALPSDGRPVGLQYVSAMISIDQKTIEEEIEPYLMQMGLADRTSKGRRKIENISAVYK